MIVGESVTFILRTLRWSSVGDKRMWSLILLLERPLP
jgi:hypothetical protein